MKRIVISGINLFSGGTLSIYKDCLDSIIRTRRYLDYEIIIFVYDLDLFKEYKDYFKVVELKKSRSSYFYRMYYEYFYFKRFSKDNHVDVWFSIHDMTPAVRAEKRYVYCHNSTPFYKMSLKEFWFEPKLKMFSMFYKYVYKINILKNTAVIVQQNWLKEEFQRMFSVKNVIVSYPDIRLKESHILPNADNNSDDLIFFYPSFPRVFKNFELLCEAAEILKSKGYRNFKVAITLDGNENRYTSAIVRKYCTNNNILFLGVLPRNEVFEWYEKADFLIFPSKLETWGLPITEFKVFDKPIIISDLPYAKETIGNYNKVKFFDPHSSIRLAEVMEDCIRGTISWDKTNMKYKPDAQSWDELLDMIF